MVADPELDDAGALRLVGFLQVDMQSARLVGPDEVVDAGEGDLGVLLRDALDVDLERLGHELAAGGDGGLDAGIAQQAGGAGLGTARRRNSLQAICVSPATSGGR